jgi:hypothetical protein
MMPCGVRIEIELTLLGMGRIESCLHDLRPSRNNSCNSGTIHILSMQVL